MSKISDPEQARRLARSIANDVAAYNEKKLHTVGPGGDPSEVLADELKEGRALFLNRVEAELLPLYDEVVREALAEALRPVAAPARPVSPAGLVDDPEKARRIARAIAGDIALYGEKKLAALGPKADPLAALAKEIEEGRALFSRRVDPALVGLFDEALREALKL
jgi:hypothetical protein